MEEAVAVADVEEGAAARGSDAVAAASTVEMVACGLDQVRVLCRFGSAAAVVGERVQELRPPPRTLWLCTSPRLSILADSGAACAGDDGERS
jgi:hypothetical protein